MIAHGGNLSEAARLYGEPADGWLDLSTGINAVPYPLPPLAESVWQQLPQQAEERRLIAAARAAYGTAPAAGVVAAPGTQALIQLLPRLVQSGPVAILSPTYGEHALVWRQAGHLVQEISNLPASDGPSVLVVVNPNNPTGTRWNPESLLAATEAMRAEGGLLVVDEAFVDVAPDLSLAGRADTEGLVVLRSFGKFFGLAGVRLGFAAGPLPLIDKLRAWLGPWAVSGPALAIGAAALADRAWITAMRADLAERAARLDGLLAAADLHVIGGTDLFRLVETDRVAEVHGRLARAGIWTRAFPDNPEWLRFGVPGPEFEFCRLEGALLRSGSIKT